MSRHAGRPRLRRHRRVGGADGPGSRNPCTVGSSRRRSPTGSGTRSGIATMAVGNVSSWMDVNTIIAAGRADLCLLARAHLFDPYWTRHAAAHAGLRAALAAPVRVGGAVHAPLRVPLRRGVAASSALRGDGSLRLRDGAVEDLVEDAASPCDDVAVDGSGPTYARPMAATGAAAAKRPDPRTSRPTGIPMPMPMPTPPPPTVPPKIPAASWRRFSSIRIRVRPSRTDTTIWIVRVLFADSALQVNVRPRSAGCPWSFETSCTAAKIRSKPMSGSSPSSSVSRTTARSSPTRVRHTDPPSRPASTSRAARRREARSIPASLAMSSRSDRVSPAAGALGSLCWSSVARFRIRPISFSP